MPRVALLIVGALFVLSACSSPSPSPTPPPPTVAPAPTVAPPPASAASPVAAASPSPVAASTTAGVQVPSPDYGLHVFVWGHPDTTARDLQAATDVGAHWQKSLFQWRLIEGAGKGQFDWSESDRVVKASAAAGLKIIARVDFEPAWSRKDNANNGPPDNYQDYWDFVSALAQRYTPDSPVGPVQAIEVWNEPNLDREWGNQPISRQQAADYVRLLGGAYKAAKAVNPGMIVISAGLSPTGITDSHSADDVEYMQWLFDAGLKGGVNYDALGAHGNAQAPDVEAAPGSLPDFPHGSFYFRRIEQVREVQARNGDSDRQMWLLEFGWTSDTVHPDYKWFAVSEQKKAQNIVGAFTYARQHWTPWIGTMAVWNLPDPTWTADREEFWWAIAAPDGTPRDAYTRLKNARTSGPLT